MMPVGTPPAASAAAKRLAASPMRKAATFAATMRSPLAANSNFRCFSISVTGTGSSDAAAPSMTMLFALTVPALRASAPASTATRRGAENSTSKSLPVSG